MDNNSHHNKFYSLLSLKLSGDATTEDLVQLQELLSAYPEFRFLYDQMHTSRGNDQAEMQRTEAAYAAHYVKHLHMSEAALPVENIPVLPHQGTRRRWIKRVSWGAAAMVAGIIGGLFLWKPAVFSGKKGERVHEVATRKGAKSSVTLPDGSVLVLNSGSSVTYGDGFGEDHRKITLQGEAYFDVEQDALLPFIVHTEKGDIRVLGTVFNVRAYRGEEKFETSLLNGKVEVLVHRGENRNFILQPSQKLVIRDVAGPVEDNGAKGMAPEDLIKLTSITKQDSLVAETSWISNQMLFVNKPLSEIAEDLERRFGITVRFKSEKTKNYRYTGIFDDADLNEILVILNLSKKIGYQLTKQELIID